MLYSLHKSGKARKLYKILNHAFPKCSPRAFHDALYILYCLTIFKLMRAVAM